MMMSGRLLLALVLAASAAQQPQQKPPLIRSQITTVPVDVRVLDRDGKPITDLTAADFTILENGVRQSIQHFSSQTFTAEPAAAAAPPAFTRGETAATVRPSNRRAFLIVLGRGRHQQVSKYVDGLNDFVKQLLPQDQVAVMGWNRATDFTADRARVTAILERFRERHPKVETQLSEWFSGLRAVYGSKDIPPQIQKEIDAVFAAAPDLRPRALTPSPDSDMGTRIEQARKMAAEIYSDELVKTFEDASFLQDMRAGILASLAGISFEEYAAMAGDVMQDVGNVYAAIDYLRYLEGEKHIIFLTAKGIDLPLLEGNRGVARVAADARVAFNIVYTGGTVGAPPARYVMTPQGSRLQMSPTATVGMTYNQSFSVGDLRMIANTTGGQMSAYLRAGEAFSRLHNAIEHQYLLAYSPVKPATDGSFRNIEIRVNRPGARVFYRHGYYATARVIPLNRRDFVTFNRIRAAARLGREIDHIGVTIGDVKPADDGKELVVNLIVRVDKLSLIEEGGIRRASLDVAVYAGDRKSVSVGESLSRVDLSFRDDGYRDALVKGAPITIRVPIKSAPHQLKAVVYDYGADLLGSSVRKLGS